MRHLIIVTALGNGWSVRADTIEPVVFLAGSDAEAAATRLARRLAEAGDTAEVQVFLRNNELGGSYLFSPTVPTPRIRLDDLT